MGFANDRFEEAGWVQIDQDYRKRFGKQKVTRITELGHYVSTLMTKQQFEDSGFNEKTGNKFATRVALYEAIVYLYEQWNVSNMFITDGRYYVVWGEGEQPDVSVVYVLHENPITQDQRNALANMFNTKVQEITPTLGILKWKT